MKNIIIITILLGSFSSFSQILTETTTTRAVIIGIANYQDSAIPDLRFSDKDAKALVEYLKSPAGGALSEDEMIVLLNEKATNSRIADALIWLLEESKAGDKAIIYFSGHGDVETITRFNRGYLLTYDSPPKVYMAGALNIRDLQDIISTLSEQEVQVIMISDACRAGKLAGSEVGGTAATAQNLSKQFANEIKILSCQPNEFSLEGEQWGGGRGAFSYHLLDGLQGLADKNKDAQVNLFEIGRYLEDLVPMETAPHSQMPFTVGDRNTRLALIDEAVLAKLEKEKAQARQVLSMIETKGMEELVLEKVDTTLKEMYAAFTAALENKELLEPSETCAYDLYQKLSQEASIKDLHNIMRRNLSVALQEDSQQAVNAYLAANPTELNRRYESEEDYSLYPRYLEKAAELLGEKHFYYKNLMAKLYYFEGLKIRLDADKDVEYANYQNAIEKQWAALEYQEYAPFILNEIGVLYTRMKQGEKAILYYEKAIEIAPEWGLPYVNLCLEYYYNNDRKKAVEIGNKALELMPDYPQLYNLLAWTYTNEGGEYEDKRALRRKGMEMKEDFIFIMDNVSTAYEKKVKYEKVIEFLNKAIELDSTYAAAHANLGKIYRQLGNNEDALFHQNAALKINPKNDFALAEKGVLLSFGKARLEEALEIIQQAIALAEQEHPERAAVYYHNYGAICVNIGETDKGISLLLKSLELDPTMRNAHQNIANIYRGKNQLDLTEWHLIKAIEAAPSSPIGYENLGNYYTSINRLDDAEWMYLQALKVFPEYRKGANSLLDFYKITASYPKALEWLQAILKKEPDNPFLKATAGKFAYLNKQFKEATTYFIKTTEFSKDPSIFSDIGIFYYKHAEFELAHHYLSKGIELDSTYRHTYGELSSLIYHKNQSPEAKAILDQYKAKYGSISETDFLIENTLLSYYHENYEQCLIDSKKAEAYHPAVVGFPTLFEGFREEDYETAAIYLEALIQIAPRDLQATYLLCRTKVLQGKFEEALKFLSVALTSGASYEFVEKDWVLDPIRKTDGYQQLMRRHFPEKYDDLSTVDLKAEVPIYFKENCLLLADLYERFEEGERAAVLREKVETMKTK